MSWVLYNVAHKNSFIKSSDGHAWIRILGFFGDRDTAIQHAKSYTKYDAGLEIRLAPCNEFRMLLQSKYNDITHKDGSVDLDMDLRNYETTKHATLLQMHEEKRKKAFEETYENAKQKKAGDVYVSGQEIASSYIKEANEFNSSCEGMETLSHLKSSSTDKTVNPNISCKKVPREFELRMQKFAAFSIIPDYEHQQQMDAYVSQWEKQFEDFFIGKRNSLFIEAMNAQKVQKENPMTSEKNEDILWKNLNVEKPHRAVVFNEWIKDNALPEFNGAEPAVAFLKSAESEEELKLWIENEYQNGNVDIAVVTMYEWIRVQDTWNEQVHRTFRHPMINKLHQNKLLQKKEAKKIEGTAKEIEINA